MIPYEKMYENPFIAKLMILYAVREYKKPVTNPLLTKFITEYNEMNYFDLQFNIHELVKLGELYGFLENGEHYYRITKNGKQDLSFFESKVPMGIKKRIKRSVEEQLQSELPVTDILVDFTPEKNEFLVSVKVLENSVEQFGVNLLVPRRDMAIAACEYFRQSVSEIYKFVNNGIQEIM